MRLHDPHWRGFASDNYAGVHPEVLQALTDANEGHQVSYGEDDYTTKLTDVIREHFGARSEVFPVFNGTGANVLSLTAMMPRWGAVICSSLAHIHTDEGGAPERVSGLKLYPVSHHQGKITPEDIATEAFGFGDEHRAQPAVVSITQSTELGTVYTPSEVKDIADFTHDHGMLLHMDGARLWNAAASLGVPFSAFTSDVGVDIVSLGGTKNGIMGAEAIVVINPDAVDGLIYLRKMSMQLASKMRFVSAQLLALFENGLGLRSATHANTMAQRLRNSLEEGIASGALSGLSFSAPTQANAVFAVLDPEVSDRIRQTFRFYDWDRSVGEVRWMCSFDTTEEDIERFVETITAELQA
ncbi:MAG: threonine aldolase family protein [Pontimonas sp.]